MKKLRFFGLLVTVLLLAFGLTVACDTTPADDTEPVVIAKYVNTAQDVEIIFSDKPMEARARQAGELATGNAYLIKVGGQERSRGTIQVLANGQIQFNPTSGGEPFVGTIQQNQLIIANQTVGNQPLSVTASAPGAGGGTGSGGGTGGSGGTGGGGGSGSWVTETPPVLLPELSNLITYTAEVSGGTLNSAGSDTLTITFAEPVVIRLADVTITEGTGKAVAINMTDVGNLNKIYTIKLDPDKSVQGIASVSINRSRVDPEPRKVTILSDAYPPASAAPTWTLLSGGVAGTASGAYFKVSVDTLQIELVSPAALTVNNIAVISNLDNVTDNGKYRGLKADVRLSNLRNPSNDKLTYFADVAVNSQGPVQFVLTGKSADATPKNLSPEISATLHATKNTPLKYNVTTNGKRDTTSTVFTFEFEYSPALLDDTLDESVIEIQAPTGSTAVWEKASAVLGGDTASRVRTLPIDGGDAGANAIRVREGAIIASIKLPGVSSDVKNINIFRKPPNTFTVAPRNTVGTTTHLFIDFGHTVADGGDPDDTDDWVTKFVGANDGAGFSKSAFLANNGTASNIIVNAKGKILAVDSVVTLTNNLYTANNEVADIQYLVKLAKPISAEDAGAATVTITGTDGTHPTHGDLSDKPVSFTLAYSPVTYTVSASASSGTAGKLSVTFSTALIDPYVVGENYNPYAATSPSYQWLDPPELTAWTLDAITGITVSTTAPSVGTPVALVAGATDALKLTRVYTIDLVGTGFEKPTATAPASFTITIGLKDSTPLYQNWFLSPAPIPGTPVPGNFAWFVDD